MTNQKELTVGDILKWSDKHLKLSGEGVRVAHAQQLLLQFKNYVKEMAKKTTFRHDSKKLGKTIIAMDYKMFINKLEDL